LEKIAASTDKTMDFFAVNPSDLKVYSFTVSKQGNDSINMDGKTMEVIHPRFTLSGIPAALWHADSWHRKSDGRYPRHERGNGPGNPPSSIELVGETGGAL